MPRWIAFFVLFVVACTKPMDLGGAATNQDAVTGTSENKPASATSAKSETADVGATPSDPAPIAPTSCSGKTGETGDTNIEMETGGRAREAILHAPPQYDPTKPMPLVLVLHPLLLDHEQMRDLVQIERFTDTGAGFLALFPNGVDKSWNAGECCGTAKDENVDDVGFIKELLAKVSASHCVDPTRIYSMGYSNGGFLSHRLACELGDTIRAIGPVAGTLGIPEGECKRATPVPVFAIHGTEDDLCPYAGGPPRALHGIFSSFGSFQAPTASDAFWAKHNGCPATTVTGFQQGDVTCARHECGAPVTLCTVQGGGHQWPGGDSLLLKLTMGPMTDNIDATKAIVDFFHEQGL